MSVPGGVVCLRGNPDTGTVVVQLSSGDILNWNASSTVSEHPALSARILDSGHPLKLLQPCGKIELALFSGKVCVPNAWVGLIIMK